MTKTEQKLVPELRFPGYEDEWSQYSFSEISGIKHGFAFKGEFFSENGELILLTPGNFQPSGGFRYQGDKEKYYSDDNFPSEYILEKGDLLTVMTEQAAGLIGSTIIIPESGKFLHNQRLGLFQVSNRVEKKYLFHYLKTYRMRKQFSMTAAGTKVRHTSPEKIGKIKVVIPSLSEQTRIADFLTAVDKRLSLIQKKKEALELYKKGIMQKIFSRELRFKDVQGKDFPDWVEKTLGEVTSIIMGQSPDSKSYNSEERGMPLIQGNADIENRISNPRQWTDAPTKKCGNGDLLLTVRAPVGAIGKSVHDACIGRGVCAIKNSDLSSIDYLYQLLLWFEPRWVSLEQGSTFTAVSGKDIQNLRFKFPSLSEQQKIVDFLSTVDRSIETLGVQIEGTKTWKKGLLQRMFV